MLARALGILLACAVGSLAGSMARPGNLSATASVDASSWTPAHAPRLAADQRFGTFWETSDESGWIELSWKSPIKIAEIVVQRVSGTTLSTSGLELEISQGANWVNVWNGAVDKGKPALNILASFPPRSATRVRLHGIPAHSMIREIEVYAESGPSFLDIRGDASGNIIGVFTDASGAAGIPGTVRATGTAGGRSWTATASTDASGAFRMPVPSGLSGPVEFDATPSSATLGVVPARKRLLAGDINHTLCPRADNRESTVALNGKWRFRADPPNGFESPGFDDRLWASIDVPSHWVMRGFAVESGIGGYRTSMVVPPSWRGTRVRLAFDGVYSGAQVWWNGRKVGSHAGGPTPFQLDVTDATAFGKPNVLAVRVSDTSMASDLDNMSLYADFSLGGIFRSAYLFSVPEAHVSRVRSHTQFGGDYSSATLVSSIAVANESNEATSRRVTVELLREGAAAAPPASVEVKLAPWSQVENTVRVPVEHAALWTAEHPNLYSLRITLSGASAPSEMITRRTGFRETRVDGTRLLINGTPVKLKGACHHDSHPSMGRAVTPDLERLDLTLMKEANLDSLRTSHYPPLPELTDIADELGMYVEEEASFCWVDNSSDLRYAAIARQLTSEMVERDRNHPSVAYWSAGNESTWGPILFAGEQMIRELDPTRPVVGSWSDHFDMEIHHNPITVKAIERYENRSQPIIWDESLCIFQGIFQDGGELWRDPGYRDYYVAPLLDVWEALWKSKVTQGSFIWAWSDDLFAVPGRASEYGRHQTLWHGVDRQYTLPGAGLVGDAPWGVVDGWRRRKPEFWHVKKLHSPVRVTVTELETPGDGVLRVPVENRYFFTDLSELKVDYSFGTKGRLELHVPPQQSGVIELPLPAGTTQGNLELRFHDKAGALVDEYRIAVGQKSAPTTSDIRRSPVKTVERTNLADEAVRLIGDNFEVGISRSRGLLRYAAAAGRTALYSAPHIRVEPTGNGQAGFPHPEAWSMGAEPEMTKAGENVVVTVRGTYDNLAGLYQSTLTPAGDLTLDYDFRYTGPDIRAREIGVLLSVPTYMDTLEWTRRGEWSAYPEDHIGASHGIARAHSGRPAGEPDWPWGEDDSDLGTNAFRSTKRNFLTATLRDSKGTGISLVSDGSQHVRATVESDRIAIHVSDWFGGTSSSAGEWTSNYGDGKPLHNGDEIRGRVRIRLLPGEQRFSEVR